MAGRTLDPPHLDPAVKPFHKPMELVDLGFGEPKTIYAAIQRGEIPVVRVGRKMLVPTAWIRRAMALDDEAPARSAS
jgi:excisionase family DNA binding protein